MKIGVGRSLVLFVFSFVIGGILLFGFLEVLCGLVVLGFLLGSGKENRKDLYV